jgi:hypothetical protein
VFIMPMSFKSLGCNHYIPSHQERKLLWHLVVVTRHHASQELPHNDYSTPSTVLAL